MRAVIEKNALQNSFAGTYPDVFIVAHSALLGVTAEIINEYINITDKAGLFKLWFDRTFSSRRNYFLVSPEMFQQYKLSPKCIDSNYLIAAYFNSGPLIASSTANFSHISPATWGVSVIEANNYTYNAGSNQSSAKIAEIITLTKGGKISPIVLSNYFMRENKIFIFDKSINSSGADFICEMTRYCDSACKIIVMSNFHKNIQRSLMDRNELEKYLNKNKLGGTIQVLQADRSTIDSYHDRFIYLGSRYQLSFTSGLDCFGRTPNWINSDGDVTIHCVHNSDIFSEFRSESGGYFRLKSKG